MSDTATVLARPDVQKAIGDVIVAACLSYGVKASHARELADRFMAPVQAGQPVTSALALVDSVRMAFASATPKQIDEWLDMVLDDGRPSSMRGDAADKIKAAFVAREPKPSENDGAGEAGGLLNV